MQKTDRYMWYLYDFANSVALVGVMYYFALWVVNDKGGSQWLVSSAISLSTLTLLLVIPSVARRADRLELHSKYMIFFSFGAAFFLLCLALHSAHFGLLTILLAYFLFNFCFQSGYVFFTSLLERLSTKSNRGKISGIGQAWGQLGNLSGMLLAFAVVGSGILGITGKQHVFFWGAVTFFSFLLLIAFFGKFPRTANSTESLSESVVPNTQTILAKLKAQPRVRVFLIAYLCYADAMMTISYFITLYLSKGPQLLEGQVKIAAMCLLFGTICGALSLSYLLNRSHELSLIKKSLIIWPLVIVVLALVSNATLTFVLLFFLGFFQSTIFALSRSYFASITPAAEQAEYFSIYVVFERIGGVVGPLLWSLTITLSSAFGEQISYRFAMLSLAIITAIGVCLLSKVKEKE